MSYYCAQQSALFSFFNDSHNECVNYSIQITLKIVVNHQEVVDFDLWPPEAVYDSVTLTSMERSLSMHR